MLELPNNTQLGKLQLERVVEYYDFPRTFTCKNSSGQLYIVISTYDNDEECHWLYLPISSLRHELLLAGRLPLNAAMRDPEDGFLYLVKTYLKAKPEITALLPEQLQEEDLPSFDYLIQAASETVNAVPVIDPQEVANATHRETFNYHIFPNQSARHEVPTRKLGAILTSTQELIDSLGQACDGQATVRGSIPIELLHKTRINVALSFQGSFGVQFRAADFSDLLEDSTLSNALQEFGNLLTAGDSEDFLSNKLHALKGRVASKYRRLLKELTDIESGLIFDWGGVKKERGGRFELTHQQVKQAYEIVDRIDINLAEEVIVTGRLIGFNSRTQRYEIRSTEGDKSYAGKVAAEAEIDVGNPTIDEIYVAKLRMLVETQSTSGDEMIRWILTGLSKSRLPSTE